MANDVNILCVKYVNMPNTIFKATKAEEEKKISLRVISMPDNAQPEQYQTFVFDGNTYKSIGPFDTEEELFNALKEYTDTEVEAGTMSQAEATALLEKYQ